MVLLNQNNSLEQPSSAPQLRKKHLIYTQSQRGVSFFVWAYLAFEVPIIMRGEHLRSSLLLWPLIVTWPKQVPSHSPWFAQEQHALQTRNITGHSGMPLHGAGLKDKARLSCAQKWRGSRMQYTMKMCFYVQMHFLVVTARVNELLNSLKVRCHKEGIRSYKEQQYSHPQNWFSTGKCSATRGAEASDTSPTAPAELSNSNVSTVMWLYHTKDLAGISTQPCPWLHISITISASWLTYRCFPRLFARLLFH